MLPEWLLPRLPLPAPSSVGCGEGEAGGCCGWWVGPVVELPELDLQRAAGGEG
jgi:hypothetical protein